jgi:hypothetical protein
LKISGIIFAIKFGIILAKEDPTQTFLFLFFKRYSSQSIKSPEIPYCLNFKILKLNSYAKIYRTLLIYHRKTIHVDTLLSKALQIWSYSYISISWKTVEWLGKNLTEFEIFKHFQVDRNMFKNDTFYFFASTTNKRNRCVIWRVY